jgi:hypothetical protein
VAKVRFTLVWWMFDGCLNPTLNHVESFLLNSSKIFGSQIRLLLFSRDFSISPALKPPFIVDFPIFSYDVPIFSHAFPRNSQPHFSQVSLWPAEWYTPRLSWSKGRALMIILQMSWGKKHKYQSESERTIIECIYIYTIWLFNIAMENYHF